MKFFIMALLGIFFFGCAQHGPYMVSPAIYSSSKKEGVNRNLARAEKWETEKQTQVHIQERNLVRHSLLVSHLASGTSPVDSAGAVYTSQGIAGGFPVVFVNRSRQNKTLFLVKAGLNQQTWALDVISHSFKEFSFEAGEYYVSWKVEGRSNIYPRKKDEKIIVSVTGEPKFFFERTGKYYHGGAFLDD